MTIHWLHWQDVLGVAGGMVILLLRSWLIDKAVAVGEHVALLLERKLVKSEREAVEWLHYRDCAAKQRHHPRTSCIARTGAASR